MPRKKSKPEPEPESPRDSHFKGFADLVTDEIMQLDGMGFDENDPHIDTKIAKIIARRAYDLLDYASQYVMTRPEDIPDLTHWPEPPHTKL